MGGASLAYQAMHWHFGLRHSIERPLIEVSCLVIECPQALHTVFMLFSERRSRG